MIFHQFPFHLDNINYRLVVASRLVLECWLDPHWREVPAIALGPLLQQLVARDAAVGAGFYHTVTYHTHGMRLDVCHPRLRRWMRKSPQVYIQSLDLEEPDPWIDVSVEDSIDDVPIIVGPNVIVYRTAHLAGVWGIWAALNHQGYLPFPWKAEETPLVQEVDN